MLTHALERISRLEQRLVVAEGQTQHANAKLLETSHSLREVTKLHDDANERLQKTERELEASRGRLASLHEENVSLRGARNLAESLLLPDEASTANEGGICAAFRKHCRSGKPHPVTVAVLLTSREILWGKHVTLAGLQQQQQQQHDVSFDESKVALSSDGGEQSGTIAGGGVGAGAGAMTRPRGLSVPAVLLQRGPSMLRSLGKSVRAVASDIGANNQKRLPFDDILEVRVALVRHVGFPFPEELR